MLTKFPDRGRKLREEECGLTTIFSGQRRHNTEAPFCPHKFIFNQVDGAQNLETWYLFNTFFLL